MRTIIGVCGRKESGKSVIGSVCRQYGYHVIRFAEPLKRLISQLIDVERENLDALKTEVKNYTFNEDKIKFLSDSTNIPLEFVREKIEGKTFPTVRDLLQVIGTDLIRAYNTNWHADKVREYLTSEENKDKNFVIDDVRFPNEREVIESLGGECWFIVRTRVDNVSNHASEISLRWQDFENIIVNDKSEEYLRFMWETFMDRGYNNSLALRKKTMAHISSDVPYYLMNFDKDDTFSYLNSLMISKYLLSYSAEFKDDFNGTILSAENGKVIIRTNYGEVKDITNPLDIEDLKIFLP